MKRKNLLAIFIVGLVLLTIFSTISVNARHIATNGRTYGEVNVMGLRFFRSGLIIKIASGGSIDIGGSTYSSGKFLVGFFIGKVHGFDPTYEAGMPYGQFEIDGQGLFISKIG
jgi:hypothetical protein